MHLPLATVYLLLDPRCGLDDECGIRYVGITTQAPKDRLWKHYYDAQHGCRFRNARWIAALLRDGHDPIMKVVATLPLTEARLMERALIADYRLRGMVINNHADGGEGLLGWKHDAAARAKMSAANVGRKMSPETRAKMRASHLARPKNPEHWAAMRRARVGLVFTPEMRARMSAGAKGKTITAETRAKMSGAMTGKKQSQESIEKTRRFHLGRKRSEETRLKLSLKAKEREALFRLKRAFEDAT